MMASKMNKSNSTRGDSGFTLIEVGVAVALFSIVLVAAGGMLSAGLVAMK